MTNRNRILGISINSLSKNELLENIRNILESGKLRNTIFTINPEFIVWSTKDKNYKQILNKASFSVADGAGIIWALYFQQNKPKSILLHLPYAIYTLILLLSNSQKIKSGDIIKGVDLVSDICRLCSQTGKSIYLLGATHNVLEKTALNLKKLYPELNIAGLSSDIDIRVRDDLSIEYNEVKNQKIIEDINSSKADVLLVAFGHPKQEKWICENINNMQNIKIAIGVGGAFDFISGKVKRAPDILQNIHIEWLWRLIIQPWRWKRIYNAFFKYIYLVIKDNTDNFDKTN